MSLTTLDAKPALVVIDLQNGIAAVPAVQPLDEIIHRAATLACGGSSPGWARRPLPMTS